VSWTKLIAGASALALAAAVYAAALLRSPEGRYAEYASPDGALRVVVTRAATWGAVAPGQSGDAPGFAVLVDGKGRELARAELDSVNHVQDVHWDETSVRLTPWITWATPARAAPHALGGREACAAWLSSNAPLQRYLAMPLPGDDGEGDSGDAAESSAAYGESGLSEDERLAAAFHRVLRAFVERDAPALAAELPARGQLVVVNTVEDLVGSRELPRLVEELRARRGALFEDMMEGDDDDYADRFSVRAGLSWCQRERDFFVLGDDGSEVTFLRFRGGAAPRLVALGTAGL
jgi:hypothetical protein